MIILIYNDKLEEYVCVYIYTHTEFKIFLKVQYTSHQPIDL